MIEDLLQKPSTHYLIKSSFVQWLQDAISPTVPAYSYLLLLLMDDHLDIAKGNVATELRMDLQKIVDCLRYQQIPLASVIEYLVWTPEPLTPEQQLTLAVG